MENKKSLFGFLIIVSLSPIGNGLHYFISGESYRNSDLRSYAVVGQIVLGLLIAAYAFWNRKTSLRKGEA